MIENEFLATKKGGMSLNRVGSVLLLLVIAVTSYFRFQYGSSFARSWDQVDFALALHRFDLLAMQPHFPGYPYFILGGLFFHQWVPDAARALAVFNTFMMMIACFPIYFLARRQLSPFYSLLSCAVVQSLAYFWIMATESMSEVSAVSMLWWYLWSLQFAKEKQTVSSTVLTLFLFSILMGIRLSYVMFGIGIILLIIYQRKTSQTKYDLWIYTVKSFIIALLFQLIWVGGLAASEGSITNFISLSIQFIFGHFNDWGGAVTAESTSIVDRFSMLVFYNILWIGVCGESIYSALFLGAIGLFFIVHLFKKRFSITFLKNMYFIMTASYFLWALFAQNIEKPRHALPLIALVTFFIVNDVLKQRSQRKIKTILLILFLITQSINGYQFVKEKAQDVPAAYQLAEYLSRYEEPFVVYTWEEARIMDYLKADYPYTRLLTYDYFMSDKSQRGNKKILLTNHVLEGFHRQGMDVYNKVNEVKTFVSNPLFDPVYHRITLYEWNEEK
ncbi:nucleoporin-interacting protein [Bacillus taeanensis]|uniref:Nucleoporin-interacting protein n=1 Tax=Bacillus taeanensis TaxID=273032 RepID=A0A366Y5Q5_9BACI|nr:nucleoporin-interacting protein [Bacillus taeanensis]RBW71541.1 nucleoporin-interacting protein [Bacillus taeanensis]